MNGCRWGDHLRPLKEEPGTGKTDPFGYHHTHTPLHHSAGVPDCCFMSCSNVHEVRMTASNKGQVFSVGITVCSDQRSDGYWPIIRRGFSSCSVQTLADRSRYNFRQPRWAADGTIFARRVVNKTSGGLAEGFCRHYQANVRVTWGFNRR